MLASIHSTDIEDAVYETVVELAKVSLLTQDQILVIGASTSEVIGQHIGTSGSQDVAKAIVTGVLRAQAVAPCQVAFQCCEHLNRALVVTRETLVQYNLDEVSVIPVPKAGGAVASCAYRTLPHPVVVEHIVAHAGVDIGDTLIGMHIKHVAVPVRLAIRSIGKAHVTAARTRPKLIGGARAVYTIDELGDFC